MRSHIAAKDVSGSESQPVTYVTVRHSLGNHHAYCQMHPWKLLSEGLYRPVAVMLLTYKEEQEHTSQINTSHRNKQSRNRAQTWAEQASGEGKIWPQAKFCE